MKFNWNADDYAKNTSAQQQWAEELFAVLRGLHAPSFQFWYQS